MAASEQQNTVAPAIMPTYGRLPVSFVRGEGVWLYDADNKAYLDGLSGIGVNALGHAHPAIREALFNNADLLHTSNLYGIGPQQALAEALCELSGMDNVFFSNSGAEANEAAIKLARLYGNNKKVSLPTIIVMEQAFHGRTLATLTASGSRKVQAGFDPLVRGFVRVPFGDLSAVEQIAKSNKDVVAVLVEPIQGEGGLHLPGADFLPGLRNICDANDWLLMLDEVQTGNGRTGRYFAYQHSGITPDVVTTAKGLGGGIPIGACLASGKAAELFQPGNHGSTFGGNPLACAVALAVVNTIKGQGLCERVSQLSERVFARLNDQLGELPWVKDIRGQGLMIGIELDAPCADLVGKALEQGLLINVTSESVVRLLPPLVLTDAQADQLIDGVCGLIKAWGESKSAA